VPADLARFDPRAVERIEAALEAVRGAPRNAEAWAELGTIYTSERLKGQAIECLRVAGALAPNEPRWPYRAAILLAQTGALDEAVRTMETVLALAPDYAPAHARLGNYRFDRGELDAAEAAYRRAQTLDPAHPGGALGLARVALQRERPGEAVALLEPLLAAEPDSGTARQLLAEARRQLDPSLPPSPGSLLSEDETRLRNDPWELETHAFARLPEMLRIGRLIDGGEPEAALAALAEERARGGDPDELAFLAATALERLGRRAEARAELGALLERRPDDVRALLLAARLADDDGDSEGMLRTLARVNALQPTHGGAFAARALRLGQLGRHEEACAAFARALELGVGTPELRAAYVNSLVGMRRWRASLPLLEGLLAERPEDGDLWLQLALARVRTGSQAAAEEALARALASGNLNPKLLDNVRRTVSELGERRAGGDGDNAGDGAAGEGGDQG
jgi:tetratricopeptide (TPR) repeat protein